MSRSTLDGDYYFRGNLAATSMSIPAGTVTDDDIEEAAGIDPTKVIHQLACTYEQVVGTNAAAETRLLHVAEAAGNVVSVAAVIIGQKPDTAAGSSGRTVTIDIRKSTAGGAFATILSAAIQLDNANTIRVKEDAVIASAAYVAGDIFEVVVTVGGSLGTHAQGIGVTVNFHENPVT